jgi:acyl-coenzyme A thioesterase 13
VTSAEVVPAGFEPLFRTSPFMEALGPVYGRRDGSGLAHGGVLLTLCDVALGYSAAYSQDPPLSLTTAQISADFAGSARIGDWVESSADIQRIGGRLAFVNVYLSVGSTRIVRASGVFVRGDGDARGGSAT